MGVGGDYIPKPIDICFYLKMYLHCLGFLLSYAFGAGHLVCRLGLFEDAILVYIGQWIILNNHPHHHKSIHNPSRNSQSITSHRRNQF